MPRTSCKVHMEFVDASAVEDSNVSTEDNASIGNIELVKEEIQHQAYAIPDLNNYLLDGSKSILQEDTSVSFISSDISLDDCTFNDSPVVTVGFSKNHTSAGVKLYFGDDYPVEIKLTWYNLLGTVLATCVFYPDKLQYFCSKQVENYGGLKIEFIRTRLPQQRVTLDHIKYGTDIDWEDEEIKSATLYEEVDVTSATIPINTAEIAIVDTDNNFDLSNQKGTWKSIQKRQPVTITEEVNGVDTTCGTLYVDTWKSQGNVVNFSFIDLIGLMDKTKFYDGQIYNAVAAGEIISSIMESAGIDAYSVADEVAEMLLTGHIAICTHREALQQVVFACGAIADCSRTGEIRIYLPDRYADSFVGTDRKFMGTTIEVDDYVSGVAITYNQYNLSTERSQICKDTLPAGNTLLEFTEPYTSIEVAGGTLVEAHINYAIIYMESQGECVVTGCKYEKNEVTYTVSVEEIDGGEEENIISYSKCTMFNISRVKEVAERILDYYQLRQIVDMRYLIENERTGSWLTILDANGGMALTGIISQSIDLTGGFISSAKCRGYSKIATDYAYTGTEIYTGERGLI